MTILSHNIRVQVRRRTGPRICEYMFDGSITDINIHNADEIVEKAQPRRDPVSRRPVRIATQVVITQAINTQIALSTQLALSTYLALSTHLALSTQVALSTQLVLSSQVALKIQVAIRQHPCTTERGRERLPFPRNLNTSRKGCRHCRHSRHPPHWKTKPGRP